MRIKNFLLLLAFSSPVIASNQASQTSVASMDLSSMGVSEIVQGSGHLLEAGNQVVIVAAQVTAGFIEITLQATHQSATTTIRVSRNVSGLALIGVGQLVQVIGTGTGKLLYHGGKLIAFLPDQVGKSLLYSQPI